LETRFLESLVKIVKEGSIAAAARAQFLTPAAINQRVRTLEDELGTILFIRSGRTVQPTEACVRLLPHAQKLVEDAALLKTHIDATGLTGDLRIGAISSLMTSLIPQTLATLKQTAPEVLPFIYPGTSPALFKMLSAGELDIALIIKSNFLLPKNLEMSLLRTEPLVLLSQKDRILTIEETLKTEPYIRYDPDSWGGRQAESYLEDHNITPKIYCTIDALDTTAQMVENGLGVSLVPNWYLKGCPSGNLRLEKVNVKYNRELIFLYQKTSGKGKIIETFVQTLKAILTEASV